MSYPRSRPWGKDLRASRLFGRESQKRLVRECGSETGKGQQPLKCVMSRSLMWTPGAQPEICLGACTEHTSEFPPTTRGNKEAGSVSYWLSQFSGPSRACPIHQEWPEKVPRERGESQAVGLAALEQGMPRGYVGHQQCLQQRLKMTVCF